MSTNSPAGQSSANNKNNKTIIIGLSGPSSSGKTTLARLLRPIFAVENKVRTFIIHEDDFYRPDDQIPVVRTKKGDLVQDWDTIGAINVDFLSSALAYVREHGTLPPRLRSKEDQNEAKDPGVAKDMIQKLTEEVSQRMKETLLKDEEEGEGGEVTIAFLEGFLLFAPLATESPAHVLRHVHDGIHLHIFLSAPYDTVKIRREARSGYVTIGPAPTPTAERESNEENNNDNKDKGQSSVIDLEKEDESAPQDFWTDPPGYVDDIVWPRYVQDHAWLLVAEDDETGQQSLAARYAAGSTKTQEELLRLAGQAVNVRSDAGVVVAPGKGGRPMSEILRWAVDEILNYLKV